MTYNARYMKICSQAHYDQKLSQKSSLLVIKNKFGLDGAEVEKNNTKIFAHIRYYLKLEKVCDIKFSIWY